jgi:hypothetical protein
VSSTHYTYASLLSLSSLCSHSLHFLTLCSLLSALSHRHQPPPCHPRATPVPSTDRCSSSLFLLGFSLSQPVPSQPISTVPIDLPPICSYPSHPNPSHPQPLLVSLSHSPIADLHGAHRSARSQSPIHWSSSRRFARSQPICP